MRQASLASDDTDPPTTPTPPTKESMMISTATTKLDPIRPEDGTLLDLDPYRRAARLRDAGVRIEHTATWAYSVRLPDGRRERRRTFRAAERAAHAFVDARQAA
jgi:hypothetical protein